MTLDILLPSAEITQRDHGNLLTLGRHWGFSVEQNGDVTSLLRGGYVYLELAGNTVSLDDTNWPELCALLFKGAYYRGYSLFPILARGGFYGFCVPLISLPAKTSHEIRLIADPRNAHPVQAVALIRALCDSGIFKQRRPAEHLGLLRVDG